MTFYATVTDAETAATWCKVLGQANRVPVLSPQPRAVSLPRLGVTPCFFLDLEQLSDAQRSRLIDHLAAAFGLPVDEVAEEMDEYGVPIRAETCIVVQEGGRPWP